MKKLQIEALLLAMAILMTSCNGIIGYAIHMEKIDNHMRSYNDNEEVEDDTIRFVINKNTRQMLMKAEVNGVEDTVLYDSGANPTAILFYSDETKPDGMKFYKVPLMGADKKTKVRATYIPVTVKTPMCVGESFGNAILTEPCRACDKESAINRYNILGFKGMGIGCYQLDFSQNKVYKMNRTEIDSTEYVPVKSKFEKGVLFVYPIINGVEYECMFDTGNGNGILILDAQRVENRNEDDLFFEGSYGAAIGGATKKQHFVIAPQTEVEFAGQSETMPVMFLQSNLASNNVGMQYIKRFDWIIDHYKEKVYAKPHVADTMELPQRRYGISTADGTLKILTRRIDGNERFKVGDRIVSVNGEEITEENICHYYDLLTENKDWSGFDIKVK